ncbi:hypothetical protein MPSEU_000267600 [Mayamaea pseudoterrestris]|nr:hypothetical protein MPSEU_000267600 [Mayamaea pseudoterrestris]
MSPMLVMNAIHSQPSSAQDKLPQHPLRRRDSPPRYPVRSVDDAPVPSAPQPQSPNNHGLLVDGSIRMIRQMPHRGVTASTRLNKLSIPGQQQVDAKQDAQVFNTLPLSSSQYTLLMRCCVAHSA